MRKFLLLTLAVALVPAFSPAKASSATLAQRVSALEAKLACLTRTPVDEFETFASYGDVNVGNNVLNVYAGDAVGEAPDQLTDEGYTPGLDWNFGTTPVHGFWLLAVKNTSTCRAKWPLTATPPWWGRLTAQRAARLHQLARVR